VLSEADLDRLAGLAKAVEGDRYDAETGEPTWVSPPPS
jgi:hypothetical protein